MAQNLTIAGASYSDVPGLDVAKTGGGTAYFADPSVVTAVASDVASGKYFIDSSGTLTEGTASGGGGGAIVITDTTDAAGGTIREITAVDISSDTVAAEDMLYGYTAHDSSGTLVTGTIATKTASDLTVNGATVTAPAGYYASAASKSVASGTATAPATISGTSASVSTSTNTLTLTKTVSVTPSVTAGYVSSGTAGNSSVSLSASVTTQGAQTLYPSTSDQTISSGCYLTGTQTVKGVAVSNTLTAANVKSGVVITIGDSSDADRIMSVTGTYSGGGSATVATKTATATNYPVSLSFTSLGGQPKAFALRTTSSITVSTSSSSSYYYIVDIVCDGTNIKGNCLRMGSTRNVSNITSGYSWSYSSGTLTVTSSAASRSASPGAFYGGSSGGTYELIYVY